MAKIVLLAGLFISCAAAQPPSVVRIVRNGSIQPYSYGNANVNVLGLTAISGLSENWLIELHDSFGSLEDLDKTLAVGVRGRKCVSRGFRAGRRIYRITNPHCRIQTRTQL